MIFELTIMCKTWCVRLSRMLLSVALLSDEHVGGWRKLRAKNVNYLALLHAEYLRRQTETVNMTRAALPRFALWY